MEDSMGKSDIGAIGRSGSIECLGLEFLTAGTVELVDIGRTVE